MRIPTVATMVKRGFAEAEAIKIRELMEKYEKKHPAGDRAPVHTLEAISGVMDGCGYEYIKHGHNAKSPAIHYVNMGDTYSTTVLFVRGNFQIGCWGNIVERGNYD